MTESMQHDRATRLRATMTDAEQRLWYHLRGRRFMGLKFRRQMPLGRYVVDFVCLEQRLVLELDGGQHVDRTGADQDRDAWLRACGFRVLRFWNNEVMEDLPGVLARIASELGGLE